jgi:hypothetical protein
MTSPVFRSFFIEEPLLTFGDGKQYPDPKRGLLAFGPCLYTNRRPLTSSIRLGIIGSRESINSAQNWIVRCQDEIPGKPENPLLFQTFPGFTRVFGNDLYVLKECVEILTESEIRQVTRITDYNRRVRNAAKLFTKKISNFKGREPRPHVVLCALPQEIVDSCETRNEADIWGRLRPTENEKAILEIIRRHRATRQTTLIPFDEELMDFSEKSDLRRLIKAEAMQLGIPTQLAKPRTFMSDSKDKSLQDEATRAWNFSVALYYKAEGYPWKLADMTVGTCYVGIAFYRDITGSPEYMRTSIAQVFTHTGEGLVLRGERAIVDEATGYPHLSEQGAYGIMHDVLETYRAQMHTLPTRLVVHKSSRFWPDELSGFNKASDSVELKDYVAIMKRGIRFMRKKGIYPPLRGTVVQIGIGDYLLFTRGWIRYFGTYPGLRVPTPLEIVEHHGDAPLELLSREIFALTKMNWNSADFCIREPITLAYAREVGKILAYVPEEVIPKPDYYYYM